MDNIISIASDLEKSRIAMKEGLLNFPGQKPAEVICTDNGVKRADYYASFLFQRGCLVATVSASGLAIATQTSILFQKGIGEDATGALFPSGYVFTEVDTNVEKKGIVAPVGMNFRAKAAGVIANKPFVNSGGTLSFAAFVEDYEPQGIQALLENAQLQILPDGDRGQNYSLAQLCFNNNSRGVLNNVSVPQPNQGSVLNLPQPTDAVIDLINEISIARLVVPRGLEIPQRAAAATATVYFPFVVVFEGRWAPIAEGRI